MASSSTLTTLTLNAAAAARSSIWISRKAAAGSSISISSKDGSSISISPKGKISISHKGKATAGSSISRTAARTLGGCGARATSVPVDESVIRPWSLPLPSRTSPWLMLPPAFEGVHQFYSLAEDKVLSFNKTTEEEFPDHDCIIVGSSHGWLAFFNRRNGNLFLWNPLSCRRIKLPSIHTLPMEDFLIKGNGYQRVVTVIISCSPDKDESRAMMIYSPQHRLAFCCPGRSSDWTPIGPLYHEDGSTPRSYETCVYSSSQKLFYCITEYDYFEAWDLSDPGSPRLMPLGLAVDEEGYLIQENYPWSEEEWEHIREYCVDSKFLVVLENSNELFHVSRFTMDRMGPDGSHVKDIFYGRRKGFDISVPYRTLDFNVHKYDRENKVFRHMDGSLDGLAIFIGKNHSFALPASDFHELKPNAIYFTDTAHDDCYTDCTYGGHDLGIFHYGNRTFSSCYYPWDYQSIKRIVPSPLWFTPSPF